MKNNIKNDFFKGNLRNNKSKIILLLVTINSLYGSLWCTYGLNNFFESLLSVITNVYFNMFLLFILMYNTISLFSIFDKNHSYIIRLKNKENYIKEIVKTILFNNSIIILFQIVEVILLLLLSLKIEFDIQYLDNVNTYNFIYIIFFIIRSFVILEIISSVLVLLLTRVEKSLVIVFFSIIFIALPNVDLYTSYVIDSYFKIPWFYGSYLVINNYSSFISEIHYSIVYIILILLMTYMLFKLLVYLILRFPNDIHD